MHMRTLIATNLHAPNRRATQQRAQRRSTHPEVVGKLSHLALPIETATLVANGVQ